MSHTHLWWWHQFFTKRDAVYKCWWYMAKESTPCSIKTIESVQYEKEILSMFVTWSHLYWISVICCVQILNQIWWWANTCTIYSCREVRLIFKICISGDGLQNLGNMVVKNEKFRYRKELKKPPINIQWSNFSKWYLNPLMF